MLSVRRILNFRLFILIVATCSVLLLMSSSVIQVSTLEHSSSDLSRISGDSPTKGRPFTLKKEPLKIGENEECRKKLEERLKNDKGQTAKRGGGVQCNEFVLRGIERANLRVERHGRKRDTEISRRYRHSKRGERYSGLDPDKDSKGVVPIFCENGENPTKNSFNIKTKCHKERIEWLTFATNCAFGLNRLGSQLALAEIPLNVIGFNEVWMDFGYRMRKYHDHLILMNPKTIVFVTDAEDVLLNPSCDAGSAIHKYLRRRIPTAPLVFSSEGLIQVPAGVRNPRDTHHPRVKVPSDEPGPRHKHVNGGTLVGRAGDLAEMIRRNYIHDCYDDQLRFSEAYLTGDQFWVDDGNQTKQNKHINTIEKLMKELYVHESEIGATEVGEPRDSRVERAYVNLSKAVAELDMTTSPESRLQTRTNPNAHAPSWARPLVQLDFDTDLMAAIHGVYRYNVSLHPVPKSSALAKTGIDTDIGRKVYRQSIFDDNSMTAARPLHAILQYTHGEPCALHQSGNKEENAILEELARDLGLPFNEEAIKRAEKKRAEREQKD
ncbi:hypothetical protein HDU97_002364 [Phlyctochytrium planicorne]|nr:hypothetical protein HDU97_002364 [Phlyctochytrium planicorne]